MEKKVYNYHHLNIEDIHDKVVRVKALMINSKKEILLGVSFGTVQFIGGHLEEDESLEEGLKREVLEETGISLKEVGSPFFQIEYLLKDYPVIGNNRSLDIYYFVIYTDEGYHPDKIYLDDQERNGDFHLIYVPLKMVKKILKKYKNKNEINSLINREMLLALKMLKKGRL